MRAAASPRPCLAPGAEQNRNPAPRSFHGASLGWSAGPGRVFHGARIGGRSAALAPRPASVVVRLSFTALASVALAACASGERPPPTCEGPVRQLNPGRWEATPNDLVEPPPGSRRASLDAGGGGAGPLLLASSGGLVGGDCAPASAPRLAAPVHLNAHEGGAAS